MNEPKINLRQISTRIDIEDYARVVQVLAQGEFKDISEYLRKLIHRDITDIELSDASKAWIDEEKRKAAEKRQQNSNHRRSFFSRVFGRK